MQVAFREELRRMSRALWFLAGAASLAIVIAVAGVVFLKMNSDGFSTRSEPSAIERMVATRARLMAMPKAARERKNPVANSPEVLGEARALRHRLRSQTSMTGRELYHRIGRLSQASRAFQRQHVGGI